MTQQLFKVLDKDARASYGDKPQYPVPHGKRAGAWMPPVADPQVTSQGYHLTTDPLGEAGGKSGPQRVFLAEYKGKISMGSRRIAAESVRLVREITPDWDLLPVYPEIKALLVSQWRKEFGRDATLPQWANLSRADLSRANLYVADLSRANLYGANLSRANLYRANLYGANLSRANLSWADLSWANLYGADLSRANLYGANLYGAQIAKAQLQTGRYLEHAELEGAMVDGKLLDSKAAARLQAQARKAERIL